MEVNIILALVVVVVVIICKYADYLTAKSLAPKLEAERERREQWEAKRIKEREAYLASYQYKIDRFLREMDKCRDKEIKVVQERYERRVRVFKMFYIKAGTDSFVFYKDAAKKLNIPWSTMCSDRDFIKDLIKRVGL